MTQLAITRANVQSLDGSSNQHCPTLRPQFPKANAVAERFEYDVFLSHANADKPAVRELAGRLKGDGLRVRLDEWVIQPGDSIPLAIEQGLESSRTLVLVMSQAAFDSEWVTLERHTALFRDPTNRQRRFVPLRLDDCQIKDSLKQFSYLDLNEKDGKQYARLLNVCQRRAPVESGQSIQTDALEGHRRTRSNQTTLLAVSRDGRFAITGSDDKSAWVWNLKVKRRFSPFFGHSVMACLC